MSGPLEREIKLRYGSAEEARSAVVALGAALQTARRLQSDVILDTEDGRLRGARSALRVRVEPSRSFLTFKGPPQAAAMKVREEIETAVGDGTLALLLLERLGFRVAFSYEKYREEYLLAGVLMAIDETPVGTFVEIEGAEDGIVYAATRLGRGPDEYVVDSYRTLFIQDCLRRGVEPGDRMVFSR